MKKIIMALLISVMMVMSIGLVMAKGTCTLANGNVVQTGFDQYGYNRCAHQFVGTGLSWCQEKLGWTVAQCEAYLGPYTYDKLVMKWNEEWDRGNAENWANPSYDAWLDNEWNGKNGGSGAVWHYKIVWDQGCATSGIPSRDGGYCIWGQFETLMDQGIDPNLGPGHIWFAHATPNGYGTN